MRLFSFLAVLSAVLSVGSARACCLFSCLGKGAAATAVAPAGPAMAAGPAAAARMAETSYSPYLEINTVGGFEPDSTWNIPHDLPPGPVEITVYADASVFWWSIDLYVTDLGMTVSAPAAPAPAAIREKADLRKLYKPVGDPKLKKIKPRVKALAAAAPAPAGASAPAAPYGDEIWVWELLFKADLAAGHNYSAFARGEWGWPAATKTSNTVTFHTRSAGGPPSPPVEKARGTDKDPPKTGPSPKKE